MTMTQAQADSLKAKRAATFDALLACPTVVADPVETQRLTDLKDALVADRNEEVPTRLLATL